MGSPREDDPPQHTAGALALATKPETPTLLVIPCLLHDLTEIQRHILARIVVHTCGHDASIPFIAPNSHQYAVALGLAAPGVRLLEVTVSPVSYRQTFRLTHLGRSVVRRLFHLISAREDQHREVEFTKMAKMMRNDWSTYD